MRRLLTTPAVVLAILLSVVVGVLLLDGGGPERSGPASEDRTPHAGHAHTFTDAQKAAIVAQAAAPLRGSEFRADCFSSHRRGDDPIVFPGQAGRSHVHEFYLGSWPVLRPSGRG
ncbi:hypothetical protein [Streptomyces sp. NPDC051219]|uniref:hypothetical protein n=1 Tax=Streptomyces sp. NPDC051219 TaxID=3155283 RepID=UPI003447791C